MQRKRTRAIAGPVLESQYQYYDSPKEYDYVVPVTRETTWDEEHPWYAVQRSLRSEGRSAARITAADWGGDFTSIKSSVITNGLAFAGLRAQPYKGLYLRNYRGPIFPSAPQPGAYRSDVQVLEPLRTGSQVWSYDQANNRADEWVSVSDTDGELGVLGAKLIASTAPTAPHNSVFTTLGELRNDGLPSIPGLSFLKKGESLPQKLGGEYLNYQFGLVPTYSDLMNIRKTVANADKLWKQYLRDSGRLVRRRYDMEPEVETTTGTISSTSYPAFTSSAHWSSVGPVTTVTTTKRKRWFSAAYRYYVDKSSLEGMEGFLERANYLYGWKPTPSAAYNLTAWTWLIDWFTNTGDVVDNISLYLNDPFLVRYAYIMEETSVVKVVSQDLTTNEGQRIHTSLQFFTSLKKRRRVNPLHWGLTYEELDARQLSILAALGMTRGRDPGLM